MRDSGDGRPHARRSAVAMLDAIPVHPTDLTDLSAEEAQCFPDCERSAQVLSGFARQLAISSPEGIRTPDLFLERDKVERSGLANSSRTD